MEKMLDGNSVAEFQHDIDQMRRDKDEEMGREVIDAQWDEYWSWRRWDMLNNEIIRDAIASADEIKLANLRHQMMVSHLYKIDHDKVAAILRDIIRDYTDKLEEEEREVWYERQFG